MSYLRSHSLPRQLRQSMTDAEKVFWVKLKKRGVLGYKLRRQHPIGRFVVDFYCPKLKLAIELDGGHHYEKEQQTADRRRQIWIESFGIQIIRYPNKAVLGDLYSVLEDLEVQIQQRAEFLGHLPAADADGTPPLSGGES